MGLIIYAHLHLIICTYIYIVRRTHITCSTKHFLLGTVSIVVEFLGGRCNNKKCLYSNKFQRSTDGAKFIVQS